MTNNSFLLDSGATGHFVSNLELLTNVQNCPPIIISGIDGVNGNQLYTTTYGMVNVRISKDKQFTFKPYYCENLMTTFSDFNCCFWIISK